MLVLASCGGSSSSSSTDNNTDITYSTLRAATESRNGIYVGSLYNDGHMQHESKSEEYKQALATHFNMLSLEYSVSMVEMWTDENTIDFSRPDRAFEFAQENDMAVRLTHLVWYETIPDWMKNGNYTDAEVETLIHWYIEEVMTHFITNFPDVVVQWNVANEVVSDVTPSGLRDTFLVDKLGNDFVAKLFQWADAVDNSATLYINEYGAVGASAVNNMKKATLISIVNDLKDRGIHIDGIGVQGHLAIRDYDDDIDAIRSDFAELAATGLDVAISELDITMNDDLAGYTDAKAAKQAIFFKDMYQLCIDTPNCTGVSLWGLSDDISFINTDNPSWLAQDEDWPLLLDENLETKDVYDDIINILLSQ